MNKTLLKMAIAAALPALISSPALAQDAPDNGAAPAMQAGAAPVTPVSAARPEHRFRRHGEFGREGGRRRQWQQLESTLTPQQQQQITAIRQQTKADTRPLRDQIMSLRQQLSTEPANSEDLKMQLRSLHQQLRSQFRAGHEKMMAVLTPEQRAKLQTPGAGQPSPQSGVPQ